MKFKKLVLPGSYVQAHPYFDTLWLMKMDGTVQAFDIEAYATMVLNGSGSAASKVFARNDRLVLHDGLVHADAQIEDVRQFLAGDQDVEVAAADVERFSHTFEGGTRLAEAIDLRFYSGRAYASTDEGLVVFRALGREQLGTTPLGSGRGRPEELERWIEAMPLQIRASLGTISASCGDEGGWYWTGANADTVRLQPPRTRFAPRSLASEFAGAGVANLEDRTTFSAYPARKEPYGSDGYAQSKGEAAERVEIVDVDTNADALAGDRFQKAVRSMEGDEAQATRTFLTTQQAFVSLTDGTMLRMPIARDRQFLHQTGRPVRFDGPGGRVLSMTTTTRRVIAECRDVVKLLDGDRWHTIFEGPAFSVRGYPQSKWYRNLVTIVGEDRVELVLVAFD